MFIVDMWDRRYGEEGYRYFSCGGNTWDKVLALAKDYGWQPMGTLPGDFTIKAWEKCGKFTGDYEVEDIMYTKTVCPEDAKAIAEALEKAVDIIRNGKVGLPKSACARIVSDDDAKNAEYAQISGGISPQFLEELITFLRKGGFKFCWDD